MDFERTDAIRAWAVATIIVLSLLTGFMTISQRIRPLYPALETLGIIAGIVSLATGFSFFLVVWVSRPSAPRHRVTIEREQEQQEEPDPQANGNRRTIGGNWRTVDQSDGFMHMRRERRYPLPDNLLIGGVHLWPRFAKAVLEHPRKSMARDSVLFQVDCNGVTVPDTDETRQWHEDMKELFRLAGWAVPVGGGGIAPNATGRRVLRAIELRGEDGLKMMLDEKVDEAFTSPTLRPEPNQGNGSTSGPTDTPERSGPTMGQRADGEPVH